MKQKTAVETRTLRHESGTLTYELTRKRVKNINLRVRRDGTAAVSAAPRVPLSLIEDFLRRELSFIERAREKCEKRIPSEAFLPRDGAVFPVFGVPRTLSVVAGAKNGAALADGKIVLTVKSTDAGTVCAVFEKWLWQTADETLTAAVKRCLPLFYPCPAEMPALTFRVMKSKWGVCRPREGRVTLNRRLVAVPPACLDYVVCHELAHFRYADHSPAFWAHLSRVMPDCRTRRRALNAFPVPLIEKP